MLNINTMSDREAMGLPNHFSASSGQMIAMSFQTLKDLSIEALISIAESTEHSFLERYAAGQLLALQGDPRLNVFQPVMCDVVAGTVQMGISESEIDDIVTQYEKVGVQREWILKETPVHTVALKNFRIRKYLVTNQEYRIFLENTKSTELPTSWEFGIYPEYKANHPVYSVSEQAAEAYAQWLSKKTKRHFRLPTEAEWEYAASGYEHFEFPWGNGYQPHCANTVEEKIYTTTPVGIFSQGNSSFGLCDMAGNVEEYTADDYRAYPNGETVVDDLLMTKGRYRVCRGGSFTRYADLARTTRRHGRYDKAIYVMGFRLVEDIKEIK